MKTERVTSRQVLEFLTKQIIFSVPRTSEVCMNTAGLRSDIQAEQRYLNQAEILRGRPLANKSLDDSRVALPIVFWTH